MPWCDYPPSRPRLTALDDITPPIRSSPNPNGYGQRDISRSNPDRPHPPPPPYSGRVWKSLTVIRLGVTGNSTHARRDQPVRIDDLDRPSDQPQTSRTVAGRMCLRWTAAGTLEPDRFRTVEGYRGPPASPSRLERELTYRPQQGARHDPRRATMNEGTALHRNSPTCRDNTRSQAIRSTFDRGVGAGVAPVHGKRDSEPSVSAAEVPRRRAHRDRRQAGCLVKAGLKHLRLRRCDSGSAWPTEQIEQVHAASDGTHGLRRIHAELRL